MIICVEDAPYLWNADRDNGSINGSDRFCYHEKATQKQDKDCTKFWTQRGATDVFV